MGTGERKTKQWDLPPDSVGPVELEPGPNGKVLTTINGIVVWADPPLIAGDMVFAKRYAFFVSR